METREVIVEVRDERPEDRGVVWFFGKRFGRRKWIDGRGKGPGFRSLSLDVIPMDAA